MLTGTEAATTTTTAMLTGTEAATTTTTTMSTGTEAATTAATAKTTTGHSFFDFRSGQKLPRYIVSAESKTLEHGVGRQTCRNGHCLLVANFVTYC